MREGLLTGGKNCFFEIKDLDEWLFHIKVEPIGFVGHEEIAGNININTK